MMHTVSIKTSLSHEVEREFITASESHGLNTNYVAAFAANHLRKNIGDILDIDQKIKQLIGSVEIISISTYFGPCFSRSVVSYTQDTCIEKVYRLSYEAEVILHLSFKSQKDYYVFKIKNPELGDQIRALQEH